MTVHVRNITKLLRMVMCQKDVAKNSEQRYSLEGLEKVLHRWWCLDLDNLSCRWRRAQGETFQQGERRPRTRGMTEWMEKALVNNRRYKAVKTGSHRKPQKETEVCDKSLAGMRPLIGLWRQEKKLRRVNQQYFRWLWNAKKRMQWRLKQQVGWNWHLLQKFGNG